MALARARSVVVVSVASAAVVAAASLATAHGGDDVEGVHACVSDASGQLRVLSAPDGSCRSGETALHLSTGSGSDEAVEELRRQLAAPGAGSDQVHWSNLGAVPQEVAGLQDFMADLAGGDAVAGHDVDLVHWDALHGVPAALHAEGILGDGVVTLDEVIGKVGSDRVADGSILARHLAGAYGTDGAEVVPGAVTGDKLKDGAVEARDLASGAVTTGKLALSAASSPREVTEELAEASHVPDVLHAVPASAGDLVMVSGQTQFSCVCQAAESAMSVTYQLVRVTDPHLFPRTRVAVSPPYTVTLRNGSPTAMAPISFLDQVSHSGDTAYQIAYVVSPALGSSDASAQPAGTTLAAVNLGQGRTG